jgi:hypothetical protein
LYRLEEHGNSSKRDITFKQLNEIINQNGTSDRKLNALLTKSKLNATLSNRAEEDFIKYIDTTKIVEINIEGKSTYSMRIETNIEDGVNFYNLLVYEKNEELKQIIIKYMPDATFNPQIPEDFKGTIVSLDEEGNPKDIEVFEYNRMMFVICGYNFIPICICNAGNAHCMGASNCDAGGGHVIGYNITPNYCFLNVAGDGSDGGGGNTTPATTTGSGGTAGSLSTIAVYFSPADIRKKDFVRDELTPDEREWLFNPLNDAHEQSIYAFLEQSLTDENGFVSTAYSTTNINFVKQIILRMKLNPEIFTSITPFLIEKNIDDTLLDPCSKNVFLQIKNTTNCDFANVLSKLGADESIYNTTMISAVAPSQAPAQTIWNSPYNYTIYISTDYQGKTKLFIAASMLHELVHAYFMSLFDDYHNGNPTNPNAYNDFAYLFDLYVNHIYPNSQAPSIHHQQMATDYADAIARALQEYQTGIPVPANSLPEQIYSDLAYGSLQDAPEVFNSLFPISNPNRQRIINRYSAEQAGHPIAEGTPQAQTPLGQPCN